MIAGAWLNSTVEASVTFTRNLFTYYQYDWKRSRKAYAQSGGIPSSVTVASRPMTEASVCHARRYLLNVLLEALPITGSILYSSQQHGLKSFYSM